MRSVNNNGNATIILILGIIGFTIPILFLFDLRKTNLPKLSHQMLHKTDVVLFRENLIVLARNPSVITQTLSQSEFICRSTTGCTHGAIINFNLRDEYGTLITNNSDTIKGLDLSLTPCTPFGSNTCTFQAQFQWVVNCGSSLSPCLNPPVIMRATIDRSPNNENINMNLFQINPGDI